MFLDSRIDFEVIERRLCRCRVHLTRNVWFINSGVSSICSNPHLWPIPALLISKFTPDSPTISSMHRQILGKES